jgi:hypothetical protein
MKTFILVAAGLWFGVHLLPAADPNFSITIVGSEQDQEHYFQNPLADHDHGFPCVRLPVRPPPKADVEPDAATGGHFYVIVRNISQDPVRLDLAVSNWYDCLSFVIKTPDGKTFQVHRPPTDWSANPIRSWIFQPAGMRVFTVNFTTARWEGLPQYDSIGWRAPFKIKACFSYHDWNRKKDLVFQSSETEVQNGP